MADLAIPEDVRTWLRLTFEECNQRIAEKLSNNPNLPEESLDLTWIEHLSRHSSPLILPSAWAVKIETHYLGGLRHYYDWEIADIGVLLFVRRGGRVEKSKVALLQSKRLYPTNNRVDEEGLIDYKIGFARIADQEDLARSISVEAEFEFNSECRYGALVAGSRQVKAIDEYQRENDLPVYYQFYNPWAVPFIQRIPLAGYARPEGEMTLGTRIVPAAAVHKLLEAAGDGHRPSLSDLASSGGEPHFHGWPLEHFIADLFAGCLEGSVFESLADHRIQGLFYRRSGPISAAVSIVIEAPEVGVIAE